MMFLLYCLLALPLIWALRNAVKLAVNRKRVSQIGLPIVMSPLDNMDPVWMIFQKWLIPLLHHLPFGLGSFTKYNHRGWQYDDRYDMHSKLGDAWVHVTPVGSQVYVANAEVVEEIFSRRKDFQKPIFFYKMLEFFGRNVITVEGHDWQRHRKFTAPPLNERNNSLVWVESLRQAREMLEWWTCGNPRAINSTDKDVRTLALHVLTGAVLGMSYPFLSAMDPPESTFTMTYRDALHLVLNNTILVIAVPLKLLSLPFVPKKWAKVGLASKEFRRYMVDMLEKERQMISQQAPGSANLMSSLVRGSEEVQRAAKEAEDAQDDNGPYGLTDSEILGNVFLYNFAGHESTGNTMSYCILLLAAHPEVQEWVAEEVHYALRNQGNNETWNYDLFPKLKRCLAVMLETLRLYSPVLAIPKYTNDRTQILKINGEVHVIPEKTRVFVNLAALHTMPRYWGEDSLVWRPSRWIKSPFGHGVNSAHHGSDGGLFDKETIFEPKRGTFAPWSDGPRVCPGKKFAEVEFVAVMATLFRNHRVRPTPVAQEKEADARQRVLDVVADSSMRFTLQMRDPTRASVSWVRV